MSNENATPSKGENIGQDLIASHDSSRPGERTTTDPPALSMINGVQIPNGNWNDQRDDGKIDSEAETVVLSGQEEGSLNITMKAIKHEDISDDGGSVKSVDLGNTLQDGDKVAKSNGVLRPSRKRKRTTQDYGATEAVEGGNSSNLSSSCSSPAPHTISDKHQGSDSDRSRSSPPAEEDIRKKRIRLRKRKQERTNDQGDRRRRGRSDPSSETVNGKERRESRRVKQQDSSTVRSESPPTHQHPRTHSSQSACIQNGFKSKKTPPSLSIDSRRKTSLDPGVADSDESDGQKHRPRLYKTASIDELMTSKQSHKKIRDRSGRTPVARACATDNIEQLSNELKERPLHLNEPDYAKNTPLQIAAIEGYVNIVQYLIDQGCIVNCKNIDGDTPLIDAIENGHLEVVKLLLDAGADPRRRNGKGIEPLELVKVEDENFEDLRAALITAKSKHSQRRPSDDQASGARDNDRASASAPGGSPTDSLQTQASKGGSGGGEASKILPGKSVNTQGDAPRRRTARSEATREDLLWITATPAKLRDASSKGDTAVVVHCLNTLNKADIESMLAAARGGHDDVLEILIALGEPEQDPGPLESSNYKTGYNTPMLAAIGGGNVKIIELLLSQPDFDPTRRVFRNYTYYELAKQRQGSNWQEEYDVLKEAFDNYTSGGKRRSAHSSPRKIRTQPSQSSSSPVAASAADRATENVKTEPSRKQSSQKHLHPNDNERKGSSSAISDREAENSTPRKLKNRSGRSSSDAGSSVNTKQELGAKPRRRLLSKNEIDGEHDVKRRASSAVEKAPSSGHEKFGRTATDSPVSTVQERNTSSQDASSMQREGGKKRPRSSTSPQGSVSESNKTRDIVKKKKRQKIDTQGTLFEKDAEGFAPRGPAKVATMIASPEPVLSPINTSGTAPVANMGVNSAHPTLAKSPVNIRRSISSPISSLDASLQTDVAASEFASSPNNEPPMHFPFEAKDYSPPTTQRLRKPEQSLVSDIPVGPDAQVMAADRIPLVKAFSEDEFSNADQRAAQIASQQEEAIRKARREEAELQQQLQTEREEQEARAVKKRNDELQLQIRRAEQERQSKEKEERRRAELEIREEQRKARIQEEEEIRRREGLPYGLRRAAELSPEKARDPAWIQHWLPLYYVTTEDLDPVCDNEEAEERWISNIQVAPILANRDLELSQCRLKTANPPHSFTNMLTDTAWARRPLTLDQRGSLWRQVRNQQIGRRISDPFKAPEKDLPLAIFAGSREKFFETLLPIFWLRLSDFYSIIPRHPHLHGIQFFQRHMELHLHPFGKGGTWDKTESEGYLTVGQKRAREEDHDAADKRPKPAASTNGDLPNGHI